MEDEGYLCSPRETSCRTKHERRGSKRQFALLKKKINLSEAKKTREVKDQGEGKGSAEGRAAKPEMGEKGHA